MKLVPIITSLAIGVAASATEAPKIKKIGACDLFSTPLAYKDADVEVVGDVSLSFEDSALICVLFNAASCELLRLATCLSVKAAMTEVGKVAH